MPRLHPAVVAAAALLVLAPLTPPAFAQDAPATRPAEQVERTGRPRGDAIRQLRDALSSVDVSDEVRAKLDAILDGARLDMRRLGPALRTVEQAERRETMLKFRADIVAEIEALLDPGQQREFNTARRLGPRVNKRREATKDDVPQNPAPADPKPDAAGRLNAFWDGVLAIEGLTDEQLAKLRELRERQRDDLARLSEEMATLPDDARATAFRKALRDLATDVNEVLNRQQRGELRAVIRDLREESEESEESGGGMMMGEGERMAGEPEMMMGGEALPAMGEQAAPPELPAGFLDAVRNPVGLDVGQPLPAGLTVLTLSGNSRPLADLLAGPKPTVVLVGNASSPTFRDRVGDLAWMLDQLKSGTGRLANVLVLYAREQYPTGEWDVARNATEGFNIEPPNTNDERIALAKNLRNWGAMNRSGLEMVVDPIDDAAFTALAGSPTATGNFAFVFRPDGTLAARQRWFDPTGIPGLVDAAAD